MIGGVSNQAANQVSPAFGSLAGFDKNTAISDALTFHRSGKLSQAENIYKTVLAQHPNHPKCLHLLGLVAHQRGNSEKAVELIRRSLAGDSKDAEAHNNLGNALRRLGHVEEAVASFRAAIRLAPEFAGAHSNLGLTLRQLGDFSGAAIQFREALKISPNLAEAWSGLARTGRLTFDEDEARRAEDVLTQGKLNRSDARHLHYALGKHYDDSGRWEQAFSHFEQANNLRDAPASADAATRLSSAMMELYDCNALLQLPKISPAPNDPVPIFVFGMPRSGTTLVEQILASHPDVDAGGELNIIETVVSRLWPEARKGVAPNPEDVSRDALMEMRRSFFECFPSEQAISTEPRCVTDKSVFNFFYFPIIKCAFPNARFVHCTRTPLDTCLSIYFTDFKQDRAFTTDLETIGLFHNAYRRLVAHWEQQFPGVIHTFNYESVLQDQEAETRELLSAIGLTWDEGCLSFFETRRQVATPSDWQVRLPVFSTSLGRWRNYENHLSTLIATLES